MITFLVFLVGIVSVQCNDPLWKPFNTFVDDLVNKTQNFKDFMADQETTFLANVTNNTKKMQDFFETQQRHVRDSWKSYGENLKETNDQVKNYFKDANERLEADFQKYVNSPPKIWSLFSKSSEPDELITSPEVDLSTPGMIAAHGYSCESHTVVTDDGYILTVHRIPHGKISPPGKTSSKTVLLHHGLFASSADWVFAGPNRSIAYALADAGYDVWLANVRGNRYSREHTTFKTDSMKYWNFSWHEIATHDLPAIIDYIHRIKEPGTKINYIGHSMGTTVLFALLATKPEYNEKLNAGIALAPVVFTSDVRGPARMLAPYASNLGYVATLLGAKEFAPRTPGRGWLGSDACDEERLDSDTCKHFIFMLCGFDEDQLDRAMLPAFLSHIGSGTSIKTVAHFAQEITSGGRFQHFDYGLTENVGIYGTTSPPEYRLENINLPIALFSSKNDPLSSEVDVMKLFDGLKNTKEHYSIPFEKFNHLDFLWAKDVQKLVHRKLFEVLNRWVP